MKPSRFSRTAHVTPGTASFKVFLLSQYSPVETEVNDEEHETGLGLLVQGRGSNP
jgi:hypothetical protein